MSTPYTVQPNDTWDTVACANGISATALLEANGVTANPPPPLQPNTTITLPPPMWPVPVPVAPSNGTTSATLVCQPGGDLPLDATTSLLFSPKAPLAQAGGDAAAVWACVPSGFNVGAPEVLVYFHGHDYFVTAERRASGTVAARVPGWIPPKSAAATAASGRVTSSAWGVCGTRFKFDTLPSGTHLPVVLLPEDGSLSTATGALNAGGYFSVESSVGTLSDPATLGAVVNDCLARLACLSPPSGSAKYLSQPVATGDLKRLFLTGHSGGGVPLFTACASALARSTPTSLWALDATYGAPAASVRAFCEAWDTSSHLGNGAADGRVVIVYNPASGTQNGAKGVRDNLRSAAGGRKAFSVTEVTHDPSNNASVVTAVRSNPIVIVQTSVDHNSIPGTFTRILLASEP